MSPAAMESVTITFDRTRRWCLGTGVVSLALGLAGSRFAAPQFFRSYLVAYLFWLGIALGSLGILMLHHLVGGLWGLVIRRPLESAARTLPILALFFVPLLFGLHHLYSWSLPGARADELIRHKSPYLNVPFFVVRVVVYLGIWTLIARLLTRWSAEQDRTGDAALAEKMQRLSGPGLVIYALTITFAGFDWVMSLEPKWWSSILGMLVLVGQGLSALAFAVIVARRLADRGPYARLATPAVFHDLGNLMLMFVMLWAYLSFCQFLIIWSGNLVEEIAWYQPRVQTSWVWVAVGLLLFYFFVPFFALLSRRNKRTRRFLAGLASALIVLRLLDLIWMVEPTFARKGLSLHWMDLMLPVGVGGIWIASFLRELARHSLLPPEAEGAPEHG